MDVDCDAADFKVPSSFEARSGNKKRILQVTGMYFEDINPTPKDRQTVLSNSNGGGSVASSRIRNIKGRNVRCPPTFPLSLSRSWELDS